MGEGVTMLRPNYNCFGEPIRDLSGNNMQDSASISGKQRGNLQWALTTILILSIGALVLDYFEYSLASTMLDGIRHGPHFSNIRSVEEQAASDFEGTQEKVRWRMAIHSGLVCLALVGFWCVPRKDVVPKR
jgi:hypothetical protein